MIHFIVLTLFKDMFTSFLTTSIIKRSLDSQKLTVNLIDIRDFSLSNNKKVDFPPYGGGSGMVLSAEPIARALEYALTLKTTQDYEIIYLSPRGEVLKQAIAQTMAEGNLTKTYILVCGHYEGIDERVIEEYQMREISIGDYVLTGGELPAMVLIDTIVRLVPGVIASDSLKEESHSSCMLEYPQYTKPSVFRGREVPAVLVSGNHQLIDAFRELQALKITKKNRPDMLEKKE